MTKEPISYTFTGNSPVELLKEARCKCGIVGCQGPSGFQAIGCILRQHNSNDDEETRR